MRGFSSGRIATVLVGAGTIACLSSCGFHPLYSGSNGVRANADLSSVEIFSIPDRSGQTLRNYLVDSTQVNDKAEKPRFGLSVSLVELRGDLGYLLDATTDYSKLTITANYVLRNLATGQSVLTGQVQAIDSYSSLGQGYSVVIAEEDARQRAIRQLSNDLVVRLSLFFERA